MLINEIYESRQGEGFLTGTQSVFVRTAGCNLRCSFCDTPYTSWEPEGKPMTVAEIMDVINSFAVDHVVITGGEPMLPKEIVELTQELRDSQRHITIETAGTNLQPVVCDLMSISPKLSNSTPSKDQGGGWHVRHEATRFRREILRELTQRYGYQLKFVVAAQQDLIEIEDMLSTLGNISRKRVMLMPEGIETQVLASRAEWLEPLCVAKGFTFCPRKHIEWYGNKRGT